MYYYDATYILVVIGALISILASMNVKSTYKRYSKLRNARNLTSEEVAMMILKSAGIYDVQIAQVSGDLTDHYSPNEKVLRLSQSVYGSSSVAAIGVAAPECGHAIQHKEGYAPLKLRSASVPVANFGSMLSWPLIFIGLILGFMNLARVGVLLFTVVIFFQLITLPVEFDASHRALKVLKSGLILEDDELDGAKKVLSAAALTYVAALAASILQLLRLILLTQGRGRRRN